jgi:hypothetical protein
MKEASSRLAEGNVIGSNKPVVPPMPLERWMQFLRNHRDAIAAMDFFTVTTATFRILDVWFAIDHADRRVLH